MLFPWGLNERDSLFSLEQCALAIDFIQELKIGQFNTSMESFYVDFRGDLKLGDFNLAVEDGDNFLEWRVP